MLALDGKTAVVTGAGSGIGRGIALALAGAGADVLCADIVPERAEATARMVRDLPTGAGRMIWEQRGYVRTIVNGQTIVEDGRATSATPGDVLRFNQ